MIFDNEYNFLYRCLYSKLKTKLNIFKIKSSFWKNVYEVNTQNRKYILKIAWRINGSSSVLNEIKAFKITTSKKIYNTPNIVYLDCVDNMDMLIVEHIRNEEDFKTEEIAIILNKIHCITKRNNSLSYYDFANNILKDIFILLANKYYQKNLKDLNKSVLTLLNKIIRKLKSDYIFLKNEFKLSFLNGDLDHDIYVQRKVVYMIDWHTAGFGDRAWDIARFLHVYRDRGAIFLKTYLRLHCNDDTLIKRVRLYDEVNRALKIAGAINNMKDILNFFPCSHNEKRKILDVMYNKVKKDIIKLKLSL